jgi:hypothetical protein
MTSRGSKGTLRAGLAAAMALLAASAAAQKPLDKTEQQKRLQAAIEAREMQRAASVISIASPCAGLPETGKVAAPAADESFPPRLLPNRSYACPPGARLDLSGRLPLCIRSGTTTVDGNPRAQCYARLPLGPFATISPRQRPTRSCPTSRLTAIVRLEGPGAGFSDVGMTLVPEGGVTATTLALTDPATPVDENPILQNCFPFDCRLVKLDISNRATDKVRLELRLPERDPVSAEIKLAPTCPL